MNIGIEKLNSYKIEHFREWLLYRGDSLRGIYLVKDAQFRILNYFNGGIANNVINPNP